QLALESHQDPRRGEAPERLNCGFDQVHLRRIERGREDLEEIIFSAHAAKRAGRLNRQLLVRIVEEWRNALQGAPRLLAQVLGVAEILERDQAVRRTAAAQNFLQHGQSVMARDADEDFDRLGSRGECLVLEHAPQGLVHRLSPKLGEQLSGDRAQLGILRAAEQTAKLRMLGDVVDLGDESRERRPQQRIGNLERLDERKEQFLAERLLDQQRKNGTAPLVQPRLGGGALRRQQLQQLENRLDIE